MGAGPWRAAVRGGVGAVVAGALLLRRSKPLQVRSQRGEMGLGCPFSYRPLRWPFCCAALCCAVLRCAFWTRHDGAALRCDMLCRALLHSC